MPIAFQLPHFNLFQRSLMGSILVAFLLLPVSQATAAPRQCEDLFKPAGRFVQLAQEFKAIGPGRIFFRPSEGIEPAKAFGFLTSKDAYYSRNVVWRSFQKTWQFVPSRMVGFFRGEEGHLHDLVFGDPKYVLTVGNGVQRNALEIPIDFVGRKLNLKRGYGPTLVTSLAFWITVSAKVFDPMVQVEKLVEWNNERVLEAAIVDAMNAHRPELIRAIRYDIRNRDLKQLWIQAVSSANSAEQREALKRSVLEQAHLRKVSNRSFFEDFDPVKFEVNRESVSELVTYPQFEHLRSRVPEPSASFDANAWRSLIYLNWTYQVMTELAPEYLKDSVELQKALSNPMIKEGYNQIYSGDFTASIRAMYHAKKLSQDEASSMIGQGLYYRTRIAEARILGTPINVSMIDVERELLATAISGHARWNLPGDPTP